MKNITIISHLTPEEWKKSWKAKVVEDTKENMRAYQETNCFWGHFKNASDFTICYHKEYEIKSMSLRMYFNGHLEKDKQGCKITGNFGKKWSANLFLGLGAILCFAALLGSVAKGDYEILITSAVLFILLLFTYFNKPKKEQQRLLQQLEKISFETNLK